MKTFIDELKVQNTHTRFICEPAPMSTYDIIDTQYNDFGKAVFTTKDKDLAELILSDLNTAPNEEILKVILNQIKANDLYGKE